MRKFLVAAAMMGCALVTSGCSVTASKTLATGQPSLKPEQIAGARVAPVAEVTSALRCMRGIYNGMRVGVGKWVDNTGKGNLVAVGSTGAYLSRPTAMLKVALREAGVDAYDYDIDSLSAEASLRQMVTVGGLNQLANQTTANIPALFAQGEWVSLDFDGGVEADAQFDGVGPIFKNGGATVVAYVGLVQTADRKIFSDSMVTRSARFQKVGVTFGRRIGTYLAAGEVSHTRQDRLQLESMQYLTSLAVADALSKWERVPERCRVMVDALTGENLKAPPTAVVTPPKPALVANNGAKPMKVADNRPRVSKK